MGMPVSHCQCIVNFEVAEAVVQAVSRSAKYLDDRAGKRVLGSAINMVRASECCTGVVWRVLYTASDSDGG
jgi:hypothetical protein